MNTKKLLQCKACTLSQYRTKLVIGKGTLQHNDILFIGEAPGMSEDEIGEAFCGRSGELLEIMMNDALLKSRLLKMPSYFVTNTVLCRPCDKIGGADREPTEVEIMKCMENILYIVEQCNARCTVLVGKIAEGFYKKIIPHYFKIQSPGSLLIGGGISSPYYLRNVRILVEVFNDTIY